jgi:16S rRNA (guanine527-N7)-methyltransferase
MRSDEAVEQVGARYGLSRGQRAQLQRLLMYMDKQSRPPTSARARAASIDVHIADSLVALEVDVLARSARVADIGSGAGFPGLPLAIARTGSAFSFVESQARRCVYLELAVAYVGVSNAAVVCARAESWVEGRGAHDAVLARALAQAAVVLEYAAPLLRVGGALIDWRGERSRSEEDQALRACEELGMQLVEVRHVVPYVGATGRHLHLYVKVTETPTRFPRRPGMARKRPLAAPADG